MIKDGVGFRNAGWKEWIVPVEILALVCVMWMVYGLRTNWYFELDDYGALEYVNKYSWWGLVWRAYTVGDPWRFNKFLGYWVIKLYWLLFGVRWEGWLVGVGGLNFVNYCLMFCLGWFSTGRRWLGLLGAVVWSKYYLSWISNIHELVSGMGVLWSGIAWIRWRRSGSGWWLGAVWMGYVAAFAAKEVGVLVPVLWWALYKGSWRKLVVAAWPGVLVIAWYMVRLKFLTGVGEGHTYLVRMDAETVVSNVRYYLPAIFGLGGWGAVTVWWWRRSWWYGLGFLLTMLPVVILANRREVYYLYIPVSFLVLGIVAQGARIGEWGRRLMFVMVVWVIFGGRRVLPKWARVVFPNYQKIAVERSVELMREKGWEDDFKVKLGELGRERDVGLLIDSGMWREFVKWR